MCGVSGLDGGFIALAGQTEQLLGVPTDNAETTDEGWMVGNPELEGHHYGDTPMFSAMLLELPGAESVVLVQSSR